ncbi:hypothetical protein Bca52824_084864 [Brassica carinata]|uniref:AB hydrolase-1 domain-containing protein n=1 Tax=Brassica carinata TaxID=52824 RepID=A0A8X7PPI8_BRACI|nr:hypothetical protein Bca52824_084864 [Brassica carinata]
MTGCFSFSEVIERTYKSGFKRSGLRPVTIDLKDGTVVHFWVSKTRLESKPNLLLIHGLGASAIWQWYDVARRLSPHFNLFIPDLTLMRALEAQSVKRFSLVGLSYGGFVGYRMAAMYGDAVEKVVICCAAVVSDLEEAAKILVPESVKKLRELIGYIFYKPALARLVPPCLLHDFIEHKTLIIWGEHDQVFPLEMGKRLEKHLGDNGKLVVIKRTGHIFNFEKPKTYVKLLKSFLIQTKQQVHVSNGTV